MSTTTHLPRLQSRIAAFDSTPLRHAGRFRLLPGHHDVPKKTWASSTASAMSSGCLPCELRALPWPPSSKSSLWPSLSPSGVAIVILVMEDPPHSLFPSPSRSHGSSPTCAAQSLRENGRRRLFRRPYGPTTISPPAVDRGLSPGPLGRPPCGLPVCLRHGNWSSPVTVGLSHGF